MRVIYVVVICR